MRQHFVWCNKYFANQEVRPNKESETTESANFSGTFPRLSEAKVYDRLAADKPGKELASEATIWKLYVAEAEEFDGELVEREHRNIDVMLVFVRTFPIGNKDKLIITR